MLLPGHFARSQTRARLLAITMAVALLSTAVCAATARAATGATFNRVTYNYSSAVTTSQEASRYQVMVLQSTNQSAVASLHAANPSLKILMYMDPMDSEPADPNAQTTCTSYTSDLANHPGWFVLDSSGNKITQRNYPGDYIMNFGDPAYQQACLAQATSLAKQGGFDGIFWDDLDSSYVFVFPNSVTSPTFPTASAWQAAYSSFLTYGASVAHPQGLLIAGNIGNASSALWQQWNNLMDGAMEESFTDGGAGLAQQIPFWAGKLANVAWSEAHGKYAILHSYNTTEGGNTYGVASMLLVAGGWSSYSTSNGCYSSCETWYPEYTTAQQLGAPVGPYSQLPNGVYERWFQNGVVIVNPTANTIGPVTLGSGTYSGSGLTAVSSVTVLPTTGLILLADSQAPAPTQQSSPPVNTSVPTISGSAVLGRSLTANAGTWSGSPAPGLAYQWNRCISTSCSVIPGANGATYTVQAADVGFTLDVTVTGANTAGTAHATSAQTALVPVPAFTLSATPSSQRAKRGTTARYMITVNGRNGFAGSVALSAIGAPTGSAVSFSPSSTTSSATLAVSTPSTTKAPATYTIRITGTYAGKTSAVSVSLTVTRD